MSRSLDVPDMAKRGEMVQGQVDELLSVEAVADHLGVSQMIVARLIDRGAIEAAGVGVHRKVRASEIERYLLERKGKRHAALATLAGDIDVDAPVDEVVRTR